MRSHHICLNSAWRSTKTCQRKTDNCATSSSVSKILSRTFYVIHIHWQSSRFVQYSVGKRKNYEKWIWEQKCVFLELLRWADNDGIFIMLNKTTLPYEFMQENLLLYSMEAQKQILDYVYNSISFCIWKFYIQPSSVFLLFRFYCFTPIYFPIISTNHRAV